MFFSLAVVNLIPFMEASSMLLDTIREGRGSYKVVLTVLAKFL